MNNIYKHSYKTSTFNHVQDHHTKGFDEGHIRTHAEKQWNEPRRLRMEHAIASLALKEEIQEYEDAKANQYDLAA